MATFTITSDTNIDTLSGKAGDDTYNVNGAVFTIDQDSRFGLEGGYILGNVTGSSSLGGDLVIDGRAIRLIPYDTGSGNVPVYNTTISQGGASGLLIGVYSALNVAPTTPGSAMPASGYIKVKQWNSVAYTSGALTGIGANATGADVAGWIEVVGAETRSWTLNGLNNNAIPTIRGEWYYIGTTPGTPARTDTYQIPSNGNTVFCPGVYVETSAGSGTYELWHTTSDTATIDNVATDSVRGRVCWVSTAGVLRFGHDGTNLTGGAVPGAGCKIRIGNVFLNSATAASPGTNTLSSTTTNRYKSAGSTLGLLVIDKVMWNWYFSAPVIKTVTVTNSAIMGPVLLSQLGDVTTWTDSGVTAPTATTGHQFQLSICPYGGTFTRFSMGGTLPTSSTNSSMWRCTLSNNVTFDTVRLIGTGTRASSTIVTLTMDLTNNITISDSLLPGRSLVSDSNNLRVNDCLTWADNTVGVPVTSLSPTSMFTLSGVSDAIIEDITFPYAPNVPSALLGVSVSSKDITLRNIGSYASPINGRGYIQEGASWSRVTTTATVTTSSAHGLRVGDTIVVYKSDVTAAITITAKTIASVPTSTTFTFTCSNSGATSGVLSFYQAAFTSAPIAIGSSNVENLKLQNIWLLGTSANMSYHTTQKKVYFENFSVDPLFTSNTTLVGSECYWKGFQSGSFMPGVTSGVLGIAFAERLIGEYGTRLDATGVSWTRSGSTVTVTSVAHGFQTGDFIQVYNSSAPTGALNTTPSVTVLTVDTFTYAGANTGSASGTLSYRVNDGLIQIPAYGTVANTATEITFDSGTPKFTGAGSLAMFSVGDQVTWTTPYYSLNFDKFAPQWPVMSASATTHYDNFDWTYSIDRNDGNGFSAFKNMYVHRTSGAGTSGAFTVTVDSTTGLNVGDYVWGQRAISSGVGAETKIISIDSSTQITVDVANTATFSGETLAFGGHPNESAFPADGVKLKFRLVCLTATTNTITYLSIPMLTTATSRARLYPQDVDGYTFTLSGLPTGTTVALYDSTDTELQREDNITSGEFEYFYVHSGVDIADVYYVIWHEDYVPYKSTPFDLTAADLGLSYTPVDDTVYDAAYDDRYTIDYANKRVIMGSGETTYDVRGAYSKWKMDIFDADNFTYDFAFEVLGNVTYNSPKRIPPFTELINSWKIRPDEANHTLTVSNGILYATGGADPFVDTLGAYTVRIMYSQPVEVLGFNTGSGVTPTDKTDIIEGVWDELLLGHTTSGSAGNILTNVADDADTAANK